MSHPLINDISGYTLEELQEKINNLNKQLSFSLRSQNASMAHQIRLVMGDYQNAYNKKIDAVYSKKVGAHIDITKK